MKLLALGVAAAVGLVVPAEAKKRNVFMYTNTNFSYWMDLCPDLLASVEQGVTHVIMTFMRNGIADDALKQWEMNGMDTGKACIDQIHAAGGKIFISTGGAEEFAYDKMSPEEYGVAAAKFVIDYNFDGVDFDLELFPPAFCDVPLYYDFIKGVTLTARDYFAKHDGGRYREVMHAPQAPYITKWAGANQGFIGLLREVGDKIDHLLIQYYNQQVCSYDTYDKLFIDSACWDGGAAWMQMPEEFRPKIIVGKVLTEADVFDNNTGYMAPQLLADTLCRAEKELGYDGGVMFWQFRGKNDAKQIEMLGKIAVEECGSSSAPAPVPTAAPTAAPTAPPAAPAPTAAPTKAPTPPPATAPPVVQPPPATAPAVKPPPEDKPFPGSCFTNSDGGWWHQSCNDPVVCHIMPEVSYADCMIGGAAPKFFASNHDECRKLQHEGAHCAVLSPSGGDRFDEPQLGRKECYVTSSWWETSCRSENVCQFDGGHTTEADCLASGNPFSVWADTDEECRTAMVGKACSG